MPPKWILPQETQSLGLVPLLPSIIPDISKVIQKLRASLLPWELVIRHLFTCTIRWAPKKYNCDSKAGPWKWVTQEIADVAGGVSRGYYLSGHNVGSRSSSKPREWNLEPQKEEMQEDSDSSASISGKKKNPHGIPWQASTGTWSCPYPSAHTSCPALYTPPITSLFYFILGCSKTKYQKQQQKTFQEETFSVPSHGFLVLANIVYLIHNCVNTSSFSQM